MDNFENMTSIQRFELMKKLKAEIAFDEKDVNNTRQGMQPKLANIINQKKKLLWADKQRFNNDVNFKRKDFQIYLEKRDIQTRVVFTGNIIRQPMMKNVKYKTNKIGYPNSDAVMERGVLLPLHHGMTNEMFTRLHETIEEFK